MLPSAPGLKRPSSDGLSAFPCTSSKRLYCRVHRLQSPVVLASEEPAITDDSLDRWLNRAVAMSLRDTGFDTAQPAALECIRQAAEEYLLRLATHVRQSMLSSRRVQPIPQDFEHALKRQRLRVDDLCPYLTSSPTAEPIRAVPPTSSRRDLSDLPFLGPQLSGESDRIECAYIPKHLPQFPSRHTYRYTPVFTEREKDPRRIRERATENGRQGEDALRKLARAASRDNHLGSTGQDKKPWGRRMETMDGLFEKTVKVLAERTQKLPPPTPETSMEINTGYTGERETKLAWSKLSTSTGLPPIINCERALWRRSAVLGNRVSGKHENTKGAKSALIPDRMTGRI